MAKIDWLNTGHVNSMLNQSYIKFTECHKHLLLAMFLSLLTGCQPNSQKGHMKKANSLLSEKSPYLLQHAYNPVEWHAYSDQILQSAQEEEKLLIISIGYSTCHWCHVMERESFENDSIAEFMNKNFICVKVDREERPDLDQYYMSAVQLMTQRGGWPLNVVALPDGRTVWGGTYFNPQQWLKSLDAVLDVYLNAPRKMREYADRLEKGIQQTQLVALQSESEPISDHMFQRAIGEWKNRLDIKNGGPNRAPKVPLPNNYSFLLHYVTHHGDAALEKHIFTTLDKMALGGIYDQVGGGFSRYSTDVKWHVPHFEKMLYDNGQLLSLYSEAYRKSKNPLYRQVVTETIDWIDREMTHNSGGFYSAIDADSEGEEGLFYLWTQEELLEILGKDYTLFNEYFRIETDGFWEKERSILFPNYTLEEFSKLNNLEVKGFTTQVTKRKELLLTHRSKRIRPGTDNKIIASWNALTVKGLLEAYKTFKNPRYLQSAEKCLSFLLNTLRKENTLYHSYLDVLGQEGFLEDYAFTIEACLLAYQVTGNECYLQTGQDLCKHTLEIFSIQDSPFLNFSSTTRLQIENDDNVLPSPNSTMALNLFTLGTLLDNQEYIEHSREMLQKMNSRIPDYAEGYSQWLKLALLFKEGTKEVVIIGEKHQEYLGQLEKHYIPNVFFSSSKSDSDLPLLAHRYVEGKTMIYVCENKTCQLPVETVEEALEQLF